jgi:hypothetical protein
MRSGRERGFVLVVMVVVEGGRWLWAGLPIIQQGFNIELN